MNVEFVDFEWQYVPTQTRRRVLAAVAGSTLLILVAGIVLSGEVGSTPVRRFYQSNAVKGQADHRMRETGPDEPGDSAEPESVAAAPDALDSVDPIPDPDIRRELDSVGPMDLRMAEPQPSPPEASQSEASNRAVEMQPSTSPTAHGGLAETTSTSQEAPRGADDIIAGINAPYYRLASLDEYLRMANQHGGRFLAWNGKTAIGIGRTLHPREASLEVLDANLHSRYATRMAPLPPSNASVAEIRQLVLSEYPSLGRQTQIMLALPYAYDQEILRSQQQWFDSRGLPIDVRAVTEGRFLPTIRGGPSRFHIDRVLQVETPGAPPS